MISIRCDRDALFREFLDSESEVSYMQWIANLGGTLANTDYVEFEDEQLATIFVLTRKLA